MDYEAAKNFDKKLDDCNSLANVFELVKQAVKRVLSRRRAGLMLGLADLEIRKATS